MHGKKILIVVRDFIPYYHSLGGVMRILKLCEFLDDQGYDVWLVTAEGVKISYFGYASSLARFHAQYLPDRLQRYSTRREIQKKKTGASPGKKRTGFDFLRSAMAILNEFSIPDPGIFFTPKFVLACRRLIDAHGIKNVIVSSPPHSTQMAGLALKAMLGRRINLTVDYRDSWNTTSLFAKRNRLASKISETFEKKVLAASDHFVCCSRPMLDKINQRFFDISEKSRVVMNGFDPSIEPDRTAVPHAKNDCFTVGYFGAIDDKKDGYRNPEKLFTVIADSNMAVKIVFYGTTRIALRWQERLKGKIEIHGPVPHRSALAAMARMDALMLLHSEKQGADEVVTTKLFDYMFMEKPILVVGPKGMEAARIVTENKLGRAIDLFDPADIRCQLEAMAGQWKAGALPAYHRESLMGFSRYSQYLKYLDILV